jgi:hypothetical protein
VCTLTWARTTDGYELFFNRDELKTRRPALPPEVRSTAGVRWLAAIDADAGGTWLGVNEHGLSVGLLNGWRGRDRAHPDATSRGLLVTALLGATSTAEVARRLAARELGEFRSFTLVALAPGAGPVLRATWDGERLEREGLDDDCQPISSSSRDPEGARRSRRAVWSRLAADGPPAPSALRAFHASHDPEPGAWSPCMHREDASTVAFTHVSVSAERVSLDFRAGPACGEAPAVTLDLPLVRGASREDHRPGSAAWSCSSNSSTG